MARTVTIPGEHDTLCEGCGYTLNGLPADSRCPECGKPAVESSADRRTPPAWEQARAAGGLTAGLFGFVRTTAGCIFRTRRFFRTISAEPAPRWSGQFALLHYCLVSALFGTALWAHLRWSAETGGPVPVPRHVWVLLVCVILCGVSLAGLIRVAARLTTWEATYRGYRLPLPIVRRGLDYHAAHYLPVAIVTAIVILGYQTFWRRNPSVAPLYAAAYLYTLCGLVVAAAAYLFKTYWTAMRNLMYANRPSRADPIDGEIHSPAAHPV